MASLRRRLGLTLVLLPAGGCGDAPGGGGSDESETQVSSSTTAASEAGTGAEPGEAESDEMSSLDGEENGDGDGDGDSGEAPPWSDPPGPTEGAWIRVRNLCEFPLWIHAEGNTGVLEPDNTMLANGEVIDLESPALWEAARVTAYLDGPQQGEIEKAEMTIQNGVLNYNVTYVDWVGLPLEIEGVGPECSPTGCYAEASELLAGCPEDFLLDADRCLSARTYCSVPANQTNDYCHALDPAISDCAECAPATTPEVYACSGPYAQEPRLCAALNRGMTNNPDSDDASLFYQDPPYNTYAKWSHEVCPDIYAFSYDDWLAQGGFRSCDGTELRISFCPSG